VRQEYGVSVLMVKHTRSDGSEEMASPGADYVFRDGDSMLMLGSTDRLRQLGGGNVIHSSRPGGA